MPKVSEALLHIAEPLLGDDMGDLEKGQVEGALKLAALAWNLCRMQEMGAGAGALQEVRRTLARDIPRRDADRMLGTLLARAAEVDDPAERMVVDVRVSRQPDGGWYVQAASAELG